MTSVLLGEPQGILIGKGLGVVKCHPYVTGRQGRLSTYKCSLLPSTCTMPGSLGVVMKMFWAWKNVSLIPSEISMVLQS